MTLSYEENERINLLGSLLEFTKTFYFLRNGRAFQTPDVVGRESHVFTVCRELSKLFRLQTTNLLLNIPPGHGKSTLLSYFVAWCYAHYHDCQFVYISYSAELAETHTAEIKAIMQLPIYQKLFQTTIDPNSAAKGDFRINHAFKPGQGRCTARGSAGSITGLNCGLPDARDSAGNPRFSGLAIMDDLHKPDEVHSDVKRERVINNYNETIKMRRRGIYVGSCLLGQRLHEDDICQFILDGKDGLPWEHVVLKSLDDAENALAPHIISKAQLINERKYNPYAYWAQHQQQPQPSGGGIFQLSWFKLLPEEPKIICSFVTVDSAESQEQWADFTAFSFWGLYQVEFNNAPVPGEFALHCINALQIKIEPKDLKNEFMDFYTNCLRHSCPPTVAAIEKKSSGTGLISMLKEIPGIRIIDIERTARSGSKTDRFLECQQYVAQGLISLPAKGKHVTDFLEHMRKITANATHRHDDLADTMADAIRIALIEKQLNRSVVTTDYGVLAKELGKSMDTRYNLKNKMLGR